MQFQFVPVKGQIGGAFCFSADVYGLFGPVDDLIFDFFQGYRFAGIGRAGSVHGHAHLVAGVALQNLVAAHRNLVIAVFIYSGRLIIGRGFGIILKRDVHHEPQLVLERARVGPFVGIGVGRDCNLAGSPVIELRTSCSENLRSVKFCGSVHTADYGSGPRHVAEIETGIAFVSELHLLAFCNLHHNLGCRTAERDLEFRIVGRDAVVEHHRTGVRRFGLIPRIGDTVHQEVLGNCQRL